MGKTCKGLAPNRHSVNRRGIAVVVPGVVVASICTPWALKPGSPTLSCSMTVKNCRAHPPEYRVKLSGRRHGALLNETSTRPTFADQIPHAGDKAYVVGLQGDPVMCPPVSAGEGPVDPQDAWASDRVPHPVDVV